MTLPETVRKTRTQRVIGLVLCVAFMALGTPVQAIDQGGLGGRPAHPKIGNTRSQSIFVHTIKAGVQTTDAVEIINNTPEIKRIQVYAVDSQLSSGGAFACAQAADKPITVGKWISLDQTSVTLNPGAKQTVNFAIAVPEGTTPGEHNGCIVIQDTKQQTVREDNGIVLSLRSAIRVAVTVPGHIDKGLVFTGLGLDPKGEAKLLLSAALKNNGNVSLDTQLDIKLAYAFGVPAAKAGGNFPVLSNSEGRFNFESSRPFWGGWYRLVASANYNDNPDVALGEGAPTKRITQTMWIYLAPDPLAAAIEIIVFTILVAGVTIWVRRRLQYKQAIRRAATYTVRPNDNLHTIAEIYHMPWKRLARINKLKPPYQLRTGQTLTVIPRTPETRKKKQSRP